MTTYRFLGRIIDQTTHRGLPALRVEAFDAESHSTDLVAFAVTDSLGAFTMAVDDAYLQELFQDRSPPLAFHVFAPGLLPRHLTSRYFFWKLVNETTTGRIEVVNAGVALDPSGPPTTAPPTDGRQPASSVVRGTVLTAAGAPVAGAPVTAFDQGLGGEAPLGSATTDEGGQYQIAYAPTVTLAAGRVSPDLVVRAYAGSAVLVEPDRVCRRRVRGPIELS